MATEHLTSAQKQAITRSGGPILVSAAAGSGKTMVIVERLMRYILDPVSPCDVNDFLIITFTRKAAAELRARIARELAERLAEQPNNVHLQKQQSRIYLTQISTVHAFCADLLHEFAHESGVPSDFRMMEETDSAALREKLSGELLNERYANIDADEALRQLVDGLGAGRDDRRIPELLLTVYKTAQCHPDPSGWIRDCVRGLDLEGITGAEQTVWGKDLLDRFRSEASALREELAQLNAAVSCSESLSKYGSVLDQLQDLLLQIINAETWDESRERLAAASDLQRLPAVRNCTEPELQNRVKTVRKDAADRIKDWSASLYGPSSMVLDDLQQSGNMLRALFSLTESFARLYQAEKQRQHALDFNDLEHTALGLLLEHDLETPSQTAKLISRRFREIMVDEYQDTNQLQDRIFRALSSDGKNIFMVGDVKQSIYRFRLADPGLFVQKYNEYPSAENTEDGTAQKILLSHNFRSGDAILEAVNDVFRQCMSPRVGGLQYGSSEQLYPGCPHAALPEPQVELHCLNTKQDDDETETPEKDQAEAAFVANRIRTMLDDGTQVRTKEGTRSIQAEDIVILLRSPKNSAAMFIGALQRLGIEAISDTGESVLDSAEVETLLCILQVLNNAHRDIPLAGALLSPVYSVPAASLAHARKDHPGSDLFDAVCAGKNTSPELAGAVDSILSLRKQASDLPVYALIEAIRSQTGFDAICSAMTEPEKRLTNLRLFSELAASFCEGGKKSLSQFLRYVEQLREEGGVSVPPGQANAVRVMSIHKSKGLEFPVVFLCGLSKRFNLEDLQSQVLLHGSLGAGCNVYDSATHTRFPSVAKDAINRRTREENLSEELRILYVAMTRAKDRLIMTYCSSRMDSKIKSLSTRLRPDHNDAAASRASCLGDWVLQTALLRTEAGELHAAGGRPEETKLSEHPWLIQYHTISDTPHSAAVLPPRPQEKNALDLTDALRFSYETYPHEKSVGVPSKLTATQLKGRVLDEEAAEGSPAAKKARAKLRMPSLIREDQPLTAAQRGTAVHLAMQYLDLTHVQTEKQIRAQLDRMVIDRFLTPAQAKAVDPGRLCRVFQGPLGQIIRDADRVIREFKFSVLVPASAYEPDAGDDPVLLQGVTDCCVVKDGALTVIDFKTDRVRPGEEAAAGEKYRMQLDTYSHALTRIFQLPVQRRILYFFATDCMIEL